MKSFFKIFQNKQVEVKQLQPWDIQQMTGLVKKLNISPKELNDAIIDTGSLDINYIKAYLKSRGAQSSFQKLFSNPSSVLYAN
ncbi:MAG: hypothetical protein V4658_11430 [Bacteroidota bacterium]